MKLTENWLEWLVVQAVMAGTALLTMSEGYFHRGRGEGEASGVDYPFLILFAPYPREQTKLAVVS